MARKQARKRKQPWKPDPEDAIRLAALRWFGLELERLAIEIYATDKSKYPEMESVFRKAIKGLKQAGLGGPHQDEEECPPGYVLCNDGLCAPACDPDPG